MPNPLDILWEDRPVVAAAPKPQPKPKPAGPDFTLMRQIYADYLVKAAFYKAQREYADKVVKATSGPGRTPVRPLATMGCNGGPLLCDYCNKPMILESVPCYNVPADVGWALHPELHATNWLSYIKGGMVVEIVENETLRIYHGYPGLPDHCCTKARVTAEYVRDTSKLTLMAKFLEAEHPEASLSDVARLMFSFDPGVGVNRP